MRWRTQGVTLFAALGFSLLHADTITTRDHSGVNGSLIKMAGDEMTIIARYASGEKTLTIKRTDAEVIEFNGTTFNSGAPPRAFGIGPPLQPASAPASAPEPADTIILRGAQRRACKLIGIDERLVHCVGKDGDYPRRIVLRILVGNSL
jgi:hypothetical protein